MKRGEVVDIAWPYSDRTGIKVRPAVVTRVRASVGVQFRHAELFAGYDWLRIGGADLHGPMAGVRLWF